MTRERANRDYSSPSERRRWTWLAAALLAGFLLLPVHALAETFYVDADHPDASDNNPGTEDRPFRTIARGLRDANPGDTIIIRMGETQAGAAIGVGIPPDRSDTDRRTGDAGEGGSDIRQILQLTETELRRLTIYGAIALGVIVVLLLWFLVIMPVRKRQPLLEALALIEEDDRSRFSAAENLLNSALTAGLRRRDIAEVRFALAYVRARLGRYSEASAVLADLMTTGPVSREAVYLNLWLNARRKEYEEVERIYDEHGKLLDGLLDTNLMVGIAFLRQAQVRWSRRQVDGALHYFERLRELDVLHEQIPSHIDVHQIMYGIVALFEKNLDNAVKHFTGAVAAAKKEGRSTAPAKLGLLLCDWRKEDRPDIDARLDEVIVMLRNREMVAINCPHCERKHEVDREHIGGEISCRECKKEFSVEAKECRPLAESTDMNKAAEEEKADDDEKKLSDDELLLRNALLWHAVSLLFTWLHLPAKSGLPREEMGKLNDRVDKVTEIDPEMGDPYLLKGLIYYFFATNDEQREEALESLKTATSNDVHYPEVLNLIEREDRIAQFRRDALKRFLALLKKYLSDEGVPIHLRQKLRERLERFARFKDLGEIDIEEGEHDAAPSLKDIQYRGEFLRKRIDQIVKPRLGSASPEDGEKIEELMKSLEIETKSLAENSERLENVENEVMATSGEFLFKEEEGMEEQVGEAVEAVDSSEEGSA